MSVAVPRVDRIKTIYQAANALNFGFRMTGFPEAPFKNGIACYQPQIHRVTLRFCKQSESCTGIRNFIEHSLIKFATENPSCAVYVIPARNCIPTLRAEYSNGRIVHVNAKNMSLEQIHLHLNNLRTRSGQPIVKFESAQTAQCKSVQGMWTPLMHRNSEQNLYANGQLPQKKFSIPKIVEETAQDYILKTAKLESKA